MFQYVASDENLQCFRPFAARKKRGNVWDQNGAKLLQLPIHEVPAAHLSPRNCFFFNMLKMVSTSPFISGPVLRRLPLKGWRDRDVRFI